jgi:hypothetical protein
VQTYHDLVQLARICLRQADSAESEGVAVELRRMAKEYQMRADDLADGKLPTIKDDQASAG